MYAIASNRPWNQDLADRLSERTGETFHRIHDSSQLTPDSLSSHGIRKIFFPHWSEKIPASVYEAFECVIFHMTDLPFGRGGSPLQNLIVRGYAETQISALRCVEEMDAGPVYLKQPLSLQGSAEEIFFRASAVIEEMIVKILREDPVPQPQDGEAVVFRRRKPEDSDLAQAPVQTLTDFFDFIRMLDADSYPRAFLEVHGHRMELSRVHLEQGKVVGTFVIYRQDGIKGKQWGGEMIRALLDRCYPAPPRDVFDRFHALYRSGDPVYTIETEERLVGMVYCARHSKGGHLESLAVDPDYRGAGLGERLVEALVADHIGVISLTTRIPAFFKRLGFREVEALPDDSLFMIRTG